MYPNDWDVTSLIRAMQNHTASTVHLTRRNAVNTPFKPIYLKTLFYCTLLGE